MSEHPLPPGQHMLPAGLLYCDPDNTRVTKAGDKADRDLLASILAVGLLQPVVVTWVTGTEGHGDGYMVLAGNRRFAACCAAKLTEIPCMVREIGVAGEETLVQLTENMIRKDMSAIDVFVGVQRLADDGMDDTAIGIALNLPDKRVAQLRAMGSLHSDLVDCIRRTGSMPAQHDMGIICQAPHKLQAAAFKEHKRKDGVEWWKVARSCTVTRIPLAHARFDLALYTGPVFRDLFTEDDAEAEADDGALFMKLQGEWLAAEVERWKAEGCQAAVGEMSYHELRKPGDCDWPALTPKKLPAKTKRAKHRYVAAIGSDGRVHEAVYALKAAKQEQPAAAVAGVAGAAAAAAEPKSEPGWVTKDGETQIEAAKRAAVGEALAQATNAMDLLAVTLVMLSQTHRLDRARVHQLFAPTGELEVNADDRLAGIMAVARAAIPNWIQQMGSGDLLPLELVERIGLGFAASPQIKLDEAFAKTLKRNGLMAAARKANLRDIGNWKQTEIRKSLVKIAPTLTGAELPMLALKVGAGLPYGWPKPGAAPEPEPEPEGEAESPCAKAGGFDACDCGWSAGHDEAQNPCAADSHGDVQPEDYPMAAE